MSLHFILGIYFVCVDGCVFILDCYKSKDLLTAFFLFVLTFYYKEIVHWEENIFADSGKINVKS